MRNASATTVEFSQAVWTCLLLIDSQFNILKQYVGTEQLEYRLSSCRTQFYLLRVDAARFRRGVVPDRRSMPMNHGCSNFASQRGFYPAAVKQPSL